MHWEVTTGGNWAKSTQDHYDFLHLHVNLQLSQKKSLINSELRNRVKENYADSRCWICVYTKITVEEIYFFLTRGLDLPWVMDVLNTWVLEKTQVYDFGSYSRPISITNQFCGLGKVE